MIRFLFHPPGHLPTQCRQMTRPLLQQHRHRPLPSKDRTNTSTFHAVTPVARPRRHPSLAGGTGGGPRAVLQRARPLGKQPVLVVRSLFPVEHHDKMPSLVYTALSSVSLADGFAEIPQMRRRGQTHFCNRFFSLYEVEPSVISGAVAWYSGICVTRAQGETASW